MLVKYIHVYDADMSLIFSRVMPDKGAGVAAIKQIDMVCAQARERIEAQRARQHAEEYDAMRALADRMNGEYDAAAEIAAHLHAVTGYAKLNALSGAVNCYLFASHSSAAAELPLGGCYTVLREFGTFIRTKDHRPNRDAVNAPAAAPATTPVTKLATGDGWVEVDGKAEAWQALYHMTLVPDHEAAQICATGTVYRLISEPNRTFIRVFKAKPASVQTDPWSYFWLGNYRD